jgi:hypothetical protein
VQEGIKAVDQSSDSSSDNSEVFFDKSENVFIDNLPKDKKSIIQMLKEINKHIRDLEKKFFEEEDSEEIDKLRVPFPIGNQSLDIHQLFNKFQQVKDKSDI